MRTLSMVSASAFLLMLTIAAGIADKWYTYDADGYRIEFPHEPKVSTQMTDTDMGSLEMKIVLFEPTEEDKDDNLFYGVITTLYPDTLVHSDMKERVDDLLDKAIAGAGQDFGEIISEESITIDGYPGKDARFEHQDGEFIIRMRVFLVKNKMYVINVVTAKDRIGNRSINKFLSSFKLD